MKSGVVEECLIIEVGELINASFTLPERRAGRLTWYCASSREQLASAAFAIDPGQAGEFGIRLTFTAEADASPTSQFIGLEITQPYFGGSRYWFICPGADEKRGCGLRARMLYLPIGEDRFACRACHDLTYVSRRASHRYDRMIDDLARLLPMHAQERMKAMLR